AALGVLGLAAWWLFTRTLPAMMPPPPAPPVAPVQSAAPDAVALARETGRWLATASPDTHVIQVGSAKDAAGAAVLLQSLDAALPQPVRVLHGLSRGSPAWMILAGEFPDREAAQAALRTLPATPADAPFLRTVGKMRSVALATGPQ
ncbi:MAG: SPOR domain-containing protein, partial [Gammaproteobacteria bacterium]